MIFKAITLFGLIMIILWGSPFRWNTSPSMPIGLYWQRPLKTIHRGDWVTVCLPDAIAKEGLDHGYLQPGSCLNGTTPIIKIVIAIPQDQITITKKMIQVNQTRYPAPQQAHDSNGKPVKRWVSLGKQMAHGYWLYGMHDPAQSWDSRYYGGIDRQHMIGRYRLLTLHNHSILSK